MRLLLLFFSLFLSGCSDHIIAGIEKRQQEILVHPEHINFGHLVSGEESGADTFSIINTGDADLTIFAPVLVSGNERFSFNTEEEEYIIPAGELLDFEVGYTPETFESNGAYVEIQSDDEDEPLLIVTLEGYGDAPVMTVGPSEFDYGDISIGCDNEERVTIRNDGNLDLIVDSVSQMVTQPVDILMELGSLPEPPWTLIPGQEIDFLVSYIPTDIGHDESEITVSGNDPYTPEVEVIQFGDGDVEQWYTQTWQQEEIPVLDVLWVIDNSGSMNQFQTNLSTNISSFMNAFAATGADYNMAVITTDRYTFSTILTPQTPNVEQQLSNLVVTGVMGSGMEKGIQMSHRALSSATSAGPGGNFFRVDATLIVIYVSDEQDWSSPDWNYYINFFDNIKPTGQFVPYGVIADAPNGCQYTTSSGYARTLTPGWGYWDLIDYYGGSWYSICATDWGVQLQDLAGEVTGRRMFELDEPDPIKETIEVTVNGQVTTDWEYDEATNSVIFANGHVPEEGQTIEIDYAVWGCGE